jgi:hypothetical protein
VPQKLADGSQRYAGHYELTGEVVPEVMPDEILDLGATER